MIDETSEIIGWPIGQQYREMAARDEESRTTTWETIVEQYKERAVRDGARIDELRQSTEHWHDTAQMLMRQRNMAEEERDEWKIRAMKAEQERQIIRKNMDDLIVSVDVAMAHREAALRAECEAAKQSAAAAAAERDDVIAICRGTQLDDAAIHSMRGYVTEKLRIEAECEALRKVDDAMVGRAWQSLASVCGVVCYNEDGEYMPFHHINLVEREDVRFALTAALAVQP